MSTLIHQTHTHTHTEIELENEEKDKISKAVVDDVNTKRRRQSKYDNSCPYRQTVFGFYEIGKLNRKTYSEGKKNVCVRTRRKTISDDKHLQMKTKMKRED